MNRAKWLIVCSFGHSQPFPRRHRRPFPPPTIVHFHSIPDLHDPSHAVEGCSGKFEFNDVYFTGPAVSSALFGEIISGSFPAFVEQVLVLLPLFALSPMPQAQL